MPSLFNNAKPKQPVVLILLNKEKHLNVNPLNPYLSITLTNAWCKLKALSTSYLEKLGSNSTWFPLIDLYSLTNSFNEILISSIPNFSLTKE